MRTAFAAMLLGAVSVTAIHINQVTTPVAKDPVAEDELIVQVPAGLDSETVETIVDTMVDELDVGYWPEDEEDDQEEGDACSSCCNPCCGDGSEYSAQANAHAYYDQQIADYIDWYSQFYVEGEAAELTGHYLAGGFPVDMTASGTVDPAVLGLDLEALGYDLIQPAIQEAMQNLVDLVPGIEEVFPDRPTVLDGSIAELLAEMGLDTEGLEDTITHHTDGEVVSELALDGIMQLAELFPVLLLEYQPGLDDSEAALGLWTELQDSYDFDAAFYKVNAAEVDCGEVRDFLNNDLTPSFYVVYGDELYYEGADAGAIEDALESASNDFYVANADYHTEISREVDVSAADVEELEAEIAEATAEFLEHTHHDDE